jgi:hypothetical protein
MRTPWIRTSLTLLSLLVGGSAWAQGAAAPYPPPAPAPQPNLPAYSPPATDVQTARPVAPEKKVAIEFTTLNLMREKGIISQSEYESAMRDLGETMGAKGGESLTIMVSKWSATLYGFVEADFIHDSTQSLSEVAGNSQIPLPNTYTGSHDRYMEGIRNSRFGIRLRAPEWHGIKSSANFELDALGNQINTTEAQTFTNAAIRVRHYNLKIETPVLDFLIGQYWSLFGWQSFYFPNTVEIMGLPGELFHRDTQLRVSKTIKTAPVNVEIAAALFRSPQRDSGVPEGQFGARVVINKLTGMQTVNSTGTAIAPASLGFSATVRQFRVNEFIATPVHSNYAIGWGVNAGAFIPVIPASPTRKGNSLSLTGEYAYSQGAADQYTGLTGGVAFPTIPAAMPGGAATTFAANVDPGIVTYTADRVLHLINWQSFNVGAQYYFPGLNGKLWVAGAYSRTNSDNAAKFSATPAKIRDHEEWADGNIFWDATNAVRLGFEYAWFHDVYADAAHTEATNHRVQFSAFYIF